MSTSTPYTILKLFTRDRASEIRDRETGKLVGYVRKVEAGYWRSRNAEGDTSPSFTAKTRKIAASRLYNSWASLGEYKP